MRDARLLLTTALLTALAVCGAPEAAARMAAPPTLAEMTKSAARVFRGHCTAVKTGVATIAGARLPVTTYRFRVREHLKGRRRATVTFRQVGRPDGGPRDLGRLAGLPVYAAGSEYVLFLLPVSTAGMTSPAGAGDGAFVVSGDMVRAVHAGPRTSGPGGLAPQALRAAGPSTTDAMSYADLRRAVLAEVRR